MPLLGHTARIGSHIYGVESAMWSNHRAPSAYTYPLRNIPVLEFKDDNNTDSIHATNSRCTEFKCLELCEPIYHETNVCTEC
jgi:hypothetical protein